MDSDPRKNMRKLAWKSHQQAKRLRRQRRLGRAHRSGSFGNVKNVPVPAEPSAVVGYELLFPARLNFISDYEGAVTFFVELRRILSDRRIRLVNLDHTNVAEISPEAALLLIAELFRSHERDQSKTFHCKCASDPLVCWVLHEVGFFWYFPGLRYKVSAQGRGYLQHRHARVTSGRTVGDLIKHFEKRVNFPPSWRRALYNALIESMNNVAEHAYPGQSKRKIGYREWWLLGYFDDDQHEISFSFFDQGIGIPATIRARLRDTFRSGTALIREAVEHGISRTKLSTRGRGLPSLKMFVDAAEDGTLVISSHTSQCVFHKGEAPLEQSWNIALPGTLITWNIRLKVTEEKL